MSRKPDDVVVTTVWMNARERLILDEMRGLAKLDSDANLLRCALWFYAKHLDVPGLHYSDFGLRQRGTAGRVRNPVSRKVCGERAKQPKEPRQTRTVKEPKEPWNGKPSTDHPWRLPFTPCG